MSNELNEFERRQGEGSSDEEYTGQSKLNLKKVENFEDENWEHYSDYESNEETQNSPSMPKSSANKRNSRPKAFRYDTSITSHRQENYDSKYAGNKVQKYDKYEKPKYKSEKYAKDSYRDYGGYSNFNSPSYTGYSQDYDNYDKFQNYDKYESNYEGSYSYRNKGYNKKENYDYKSERNFSGKYKDYSNSTQDYSGNRDYKDKEYTSEYRDYKQPNYNRNYNKDHYYNQSTSDYHTPLNKNDNNENEGFSNYSKKNFKKKESTEIIDHKEVYNTNTNYSRKKDLLDDKSFEKGKNLEYSNKNENYHQDSFKKKRDYSHREGEYEKSNTNYSNFTNNSNFTNKEKTFKRDYKKDNTHGLKESREVHRTNKGNKNTFDDLKKPVFINSKKEKEADDTESKKIPIKEMLSVPLNQIEEKINVSKEKYIQQNMSNLSINANISNLNITNTTTNTIAVKIEGENVSNLNNLNLTSNVNVGTMQDEKLNNTNMPISNYPMTYYNLPPPNFYPVNNIPPTNYAVPGYSYRMMNMPVQNPNMMYNYYANGMNLQQIYPGYPMAQPGILNPVLPGGVNNPGMPQTQPMEEELNIKDFSDKLNLNAKVYVPKTKVKFI
jgi:hypothetical protein